jgi:hypothetical protein
LTGIRRPPYTERELRFELEPGRGADPGVVERAPLLEEDALAAHAHPGVPERRRVIGHGDEADAERGRVEQILQKQHGIVCSMSRQGNCWGFFVTLKVELVHNAAWATRSEARTDLADYFELFYNADDAVRRLVTSVPERSNSAANTRYLQVNPGVY